MADLRKVKSGDPLRIPAGTFNTFVDAAQDYLSRTQNRTRTGMGGFGRDGNIVLVRNDSGAARSRYDALGISGPVFDPATATVSFQERPVLKGIAPATDYAGKFVILAEPVSAGAIGSAYAAGICAAKVFVADTAHTQADVQTGKTILASATSGAATILWKATGTGAQWAMVRFGGSGGGSAATSWLAKVTVANGSAVYTTVEQVGSATTNFTDKTGATALAAQNLAELGLGSGNALAIGTFVIVQAVAQPGSPPTIRYVFDHPVYAKYL